jgi:hypothetical protein
MSLYSMLDRLSKENLRAFRRAQKETFAVMNHLYEKIKQVMEIPVGSIEWLPFKPTGTPVELREQERLWKHRMYLHDDGRFESAFALALSGLTVQFSIYLQRLGKSEYQVWLTEEITDTITTEYVGVDALIQELARELGEDVADYYVNILQGKPHKIGLGFAPPKNIED